MLLALLLAAQQLTETATLQGHKGAVFHAAFSPDGKILATPGIDKTVRLWDAASGKQIAQLDGHTESAVVVGFSADGATLASAGYDRCLRLWDVAGRKQIDVQKENPKDKLQTVHIHNLANAFSQDLSTLAICHGGAGVRLWDIKSKSSRELSLGADDDLRFAVAGYLALNGNGRLLAVAVAKGDTDSEVQLWDCKEGKRMETFAAAGGASYRDEGVAISADGSMIAVVDCSTSEIHVWDVKTKSIAKKLKGHKHDDTGTMVLLGLAFSPDGRRLASGSYDHTVRLWDVKEGKQLASAAARQPAFVTFSRDGSMLAAAGVEGVIQVYAVKP